MLNVAHTPTSNLAAMASAAPTNACCPAAGNDDSTVLDALGPMILLSAKSTTPKAAAEHQGALAALMYNYDKLPKDQNGYVTIAGLQKMVDNPDAYPADAVKAAQYFLDHPAKFAALDGSRQKYEDGKASQDGEFSRKDIYSEQQHPDYVAGNGAAKRSGQLGLEPGWKEKAAAEMQVGPGLEKVLGWKEKAAAEMQVGPGLEKVPGWKEKAAAEMQVGRDANACDADGCGNAPKNTGRHRAGGPAAAPGVRLLTPAEKRAAADKPAPDPAADKPAPAPAADKPAADNAAPPDISKSADLLKNIIQGGDEGKMSFSDLQAIAAGKNPLFPPDKNPELQAAAKAVMDTPGFYAHYCDKDGNFTKKDLDSLKQNATDAKMDLGNMTPAQIANYNGLNANDPSFFYKDGSHTPAYAAAVLAAANSGNTQRSLDLANAFGPGDAELKRAMIQLSSGNSTWGDDDVSTIGELRKLAAKTGDTNPVHQKEIAAANAIIAYYDANGGKNGSNIIRTLAGDDETFNTTEWATGRDGIPTQKPQPAPVA